MQHGGTKDRRLQRRQQQLRGCRSCALVRWEADSYVSMPMSVENGSLLKALRVEAA